MVYAQPQVQTVKKKTTTRRGSSPSPAPKPNPERDPHEQRRREEEAARQKELEYLNKYFKEHCTKAGYHPPQVPMSARRRLASAFKKKLEGGSNSPHRKWAWAYFMGNIARLTQPLEKLEETVSGYLTKVPFFKRLFRSKHKALDVELMSDSKLDSSFDPNLSSKQIDAHNRHEHMIAELSEKPALDQVGSMSVFRNHFNGSGVIQICLPKIGSVLIRINSPLDPTEVAREHLSELKRAFGRILGTATPISILNGDLRSLNFKELLPGKPILRARKTEKTQEIKDRIQSAVSRSPIVPEKATVVSALPQNDGQLSNIFPRAEGARLSDGGPSWSIWKDQYDNWRKSVTGAGFDFNEEMHSASRMLKALCQKKDVIVLIAHAESDQIFFPDGTQVTSDEILSRKAEISQAEPAVYLFCCETAKFEDGAQSIVEALLEAGVSAVTAPQLRINSRTSRSLCARFLENARTSKPIEALAEAERKTGNTDLETWVG